MTYEQNDEDDLLNAISGARPNSAGWARTNCPYCVTTNGKVDKKRSLGVHVSGFYHCFRCGTKGKLETLAEWMSDSRELSQQTATQASEMEPPESFTQIFREPALSAHCFEKARAYLLSRKLNVESWRAAGIGVCTRGDFAGRVVVPIFGDDGFTWIGYVGRDYTKKSFLKYRYPEAMARGTMLYERRVLDIETDVPCLVVEGVFDAVHFLGNAVAVLGKPSHWQKDQLARAKRPVCVVLDGDAHEEGEALALTLRLDGVAAGSVRLAGGVDPDEVDPKWLMRKATKSVARL